jgi:hypothetical protein
MAHASTSDLPRWHLRVLVGAALGAVIGALELFDGFSVRELLATGAAGATFGAVIGLTTPILRSRLITYLVCAFAGILGGLAWAVMHDNSKAFVLPAVVGAMLGVLVAYGELAIAT